MSRYNLKSRRSYGDGHNRYLPTIVVVSIGLMVAIVFLGYMIRKKTPVTFETVWETVEKNGFKPIDITEKHKTVSNGIEKCLGFKSDDINFVFFTAIDKEHAENICKNSLYSEIRKITSRYYDYRRSDGDGGTNYYILALSGDGNWGIAYYVENTGGIAWCKKETASAIADILREIGYVD